MLTGRVQELLERRAPADLLVLIKLEEMNMKLSEMVAALGVVNDQLAKAKAEILGRIAALEEALKDVEVPDAANTALEQIRVAAQALDDVVPDA